MTQLYTRWGENLDSDHILQELVVMVQDDSDTSYHARGKQKLERGWMFYTAQSGIWQSVWLEEVSDKWVKHIDTRIKKYVEKEKSEGCLGQ